MTRIAGTALRLTCAAVLMGGIEAPYARAQVVQPDSATAIAALRGICGAGVPNGEFGMLRGAVQDDSGDKLVSVPITVAWHQLAEVTSGGPRDHPVSNEGTLGVLSGADGRWHICGVPLHMSVAVRAVSDEGSDERISMLDNTHPVLAIDFTLRPVSDVQNVVRTPRMNALVVFNVVDRAGAPVPGINVELAPTTGPVHQVVTDNAGNAIVPAVDPGRARVKIRGIGFKPGELTVPLDMGRNTVPLILDAASIPMLATVRVIGDRQVLARHQEFEQRRSAHLASASITAEDIRKTESG